MTFGRIIAGAGIAALALSTARPTPAMAAEGEGTIAITSPDESAPRDRWDRVARAAVSETLGERGFTILDDPAHAAMVAQVSVTRDDVGTAIGTSPRQPSSVSSGGVTVPLSGGGAALATMQRTTIDIRIRRRGDGNGDGRISWHGAAVTVRPAPRDAAAADRLALALSRAALSTYPRSVEAPIGIP